MIISHIENFYTDICLNEINLLKSLTNSKNIKTNEHTALTNLNTWWSGNLLEQYDKLSLNFCKTLKFLKLKAEDKFHIRLEYNYLHFIDYTNSGAMSYHSHKHDEDIVFILYLNDCNDGETNFYLRDIVSLTPKKSQIIIFESYIEHSSSFSSKKQILVGGLKKFNDNYTNNSNLKKE